MGSVRFGSGIIIARLDDGSWSAPSAIVAGGVGFGGQIGVEFTNFIFVLPDKSSVRTIAQLGTLTLSANISMALGPTGRCGETGMGASSKGIGRMWSMSKVNGIFGGVSIEMGTMIESRASNTRLYERKVTAAQLLNGEIEPPTDVEPLMRYLACEAFYPSQDRAIDLENSPRAPELSSGVENQPPSELPAKEGPQQILSEVDSESRSIPSELPGELPGELPELPGELPLELPGEEPPSNPERKTLVQET